MAAKRISGLALLLLCALPPLWAGASDRALFQRLHELCLQAKADARGSQRDIFWSNLLQCWQMEDGGEDMMARLDEHLSRLCSDISSHCSVVPDPRRLQRMATYSDALQCPSRGYACGGSGGAVAQSGQERFRRIRDADPETRKYYRSCRQGLHDTRAAWDEWDRAVARSNSSAARKEAMKEYAAAIALFINEMLTSEEILGTGTRRAMTLYGAPFLLMMQTGTANPDPRELEMYKVAIGNWRNQCELLVKAAARIDPGFAGHDYPWLKAIRFYADEAMRLR
ncbi:MAG: hypothetical protein ACT4P3_13630 [Betaproteobacteria bacterium]